MSITLKVIILNNDVNSYVFEFVIINERCNLTFLRVKQIQAKMDRKIYKKKLISPISVNIPIANI